MQFESMAAAWEMGGHGPYVWAVALLTVLVAAWLLLQPVAGSRRLLVEQRAALRRDEKSRRHERLRQPQNSQEQKDHNAPGS